MTYKFYPRRPIKSFQDLEVYQKVLGIAVVIAKRLSSVVIASEAKQSKSEEIAASSTTMVGTPRNDIPRKLVEISLDLPVKIAMAHSLRFSDQNKAVQILEEIMLNCNLLVVYLELYRDLEQHEIEPDFFEEQIKNLLSARMKILHLQFSWKKFMEQKKDETH